MERNGHIGAVNLRHLAGDLGIRHIYRIAHPDGFVLNFFGGLFFLHRLLPMNRDEGFHRFGFRFLHMLDLLLHLFFEGFHLFARRLGLLRIGFRLLDLANRVLDDLVGAIDDTVGLVFGLGENLLALFVELRELFGVLVDHHGQLVVGGTYHLEFLFRFNLRDFDFLQLPFVVDLRRAGFLYGAVDNLRIQPDLPCDFVGERAAGFPDFEDVKR